VDKGLIESEVMAQKESRKCRGEHQIAKLSDKSAARGKQTKRRAMQLSFVT
jgi:hypothetical protein